VIDGLTTFTKSGDGILILSGTNTFEGNITISLGTLKIDGTGTLESGNYDGTISNAGIFHYSSTTNQILGGEISGLGALTKDETSTLTLSTNNSYTGTTTISTGTLTITGTLSDSTDVINSGTYQVDTTDTIQSLRGTGAVEIASGVTLTTGDAGSDEISGVISGDGNLTKVGSGTLTLTGDNIFTGTLTVTLGTVILDDADGDTGTVLSDSASVTVDGGIITVSDASETVSSITKSSGTINGLLISSSGYSYAPALGVTLTISEVLSGSGGLTMSGAGTLVLSGTNTFTGNITISAGTLKIDGTGVLESGNYDGTITNSGTFIYSSTIDQTLAGIISGSGALTKEENSTLTLTVANTYDGTTTITTGTLKVTGTLAQTAVTVDTNGTYDVDATDTVLSIAGAGTIDLTNAALTAGDGNNPTFSGVFNGANDFTKVGSGTLTLSGDNSAASYTGRIIIDAGTISVAADSNLGSPNILDADRLILKGGTLQTTSSFTLNTNRGITLGANHGSINIAAETTLTYDGVIAGTDNNLTKLGTGILDLGGTNTYSGDTAISNGEIILTGALSSSTDLTIAATGTLDLRANQTFNTLTISGAGTGNRIENGDSGTIGSLTVTNAATLAGNIVTIGSQTYSGAVTLGANTSVQVSGRTTSSTTTVTYGEGGDLGKADATTYTVNISSSQTLTRIELIGAGGGDGGTDSGEGNSTTTGPTGRYIVDIELTNTTIRVAPGGGGNDGGDTVSGSVDESEYESIPSGGVNSLNSNFNGGDGGQAGFSGTSGQGGSGGAASIVEIGSGSGDYIVAGGAGGGGGAGKSSPFSNTSGTGTYSANGSSTTGADGLQAVTVDPVGGNADGGGSGGGGGGYYGGAAGALVYKEGTDGNNDANDIDGLGGSRGGNGVIDTDSSLTYTEITDGTSSVSSKSKGKVILTYAGPNSAISFGSTINGNYTLTTSTGGGDVTFTGATGVDNPINGLTVSSGDFDASTIALQNSAAVSITITGTSSDVAAISGTSATLTKAGTGTLTLTGANTYSGATTINAGTLKATGTLSDSTAIIVASGTTYDFDATDTVGSIAGAGTINIASSQTLSAGNDGSDTEFSGVIEGAGAFTKVGSGSLTLTGDNTSTGTYTVSAGTLVLNDADGTTGTVIADTANVTVDGGDLSLLDASGETVATFTVTQGNVTGTFLTASSYVFNPDTGETATVGSVISGSGGLTMSGAGTLVLTAANTFTGNITISAGTLKIDGTGTLEEGNYDGTISNAGTLHYSSTTDQILGGIISSTGALTKDETSTLTLGAANTYTGATNIDDGTLEVDGTLAQTAVTVASGATYDVDATDTVLSIEGAGTIDLTDAALTAGDGLILNLLRCL
jgi:fibronectin-binding autotransporter adhesin